MPDLQIISMYQCRQLDDFTYRTESGYTVHLGWGTQYCDCPSFKFAKKDDYGMKSCKHIPEARKHQCDWHEQWSSEQVTEDRVCPKCGGPIMAVNVGV